MLLLFLWQLAGLDAEWIVEALIMGRLIIRADSAATAVVILFASVAMASAANVGTPRSCNKTDGCMWEFIYENQKMMQSDMMTKGMEEGRANKKAFEDLKERERIHGTAPSNRR